MFIYFLFIAFLIIMICLYDCYDVKKGRGVFIKISIAFLVCLVGFRYRMGTDTITYMKSFEDAPTIFNISNSKEEHYAPLFILLMSLVKTITNEFWVFQMVISLFVNIVFIQTIRRLFGDSYLFSFLLIFFVGQYYTLNCESLREAISIAIFFLSLPSLFESRWKEYYLYSTIAIGFHYGAILTLFIPLLRDIKINLKVIALLACIFVVSFSFLDTFSLLVSLLPVFSAHLEELLAFYIDSSREAGIANVNINYYIFGVFIPVICCYVIRKYCPQYSKFEFLILILVISKILSRVVVIFYRYENYVCLLYYALYVTAVYFFFQRYKLRKNFILYIAFLVPIIYVSIGLWNADYVDDYARKVLIDPYTSIFDEGYAPEREALYQFIGRYF